MSNNADLTVHIDETISSDQRNKLLAMLQNQAGVANVEYHAERPHLMIINYHNDETDSQNIITLIRNQNVHAEIIGL